MPWQHEKKFLEEELATIHKRRYCIIVSRGTVAVYLALKALGYKTGKIIVPSNICLGPLNAVLYAGLEPYFCDVTLKDFNLDIDQLEQILKIQGDVRAVLLPHMYGHPTDIDRIVQLAQKYKVKLIEDAAQALGGEYKGQSLGSFGEFSILSFGHTKILDVGGGGALLFDRKEYLSDIQQHIRRLPWKVKGYKMLAEQYRKLYYALAPYVQEDYTWGPLYYTFPYIFKELYLFQDISIDFLRKLKTGLKTLKHIVERRNENAAHYIRHLRHPSIRHPQYQWSGVFWRYSFLIRYSQQQEIAKKIRQNGVDISNWYPPAHYFFQMQPQRLKNAEYIGRHVFNLWVGPDYSLRKIERNAETVLRVLSHYE